VILGAGRKKSDRILVFRRSTLIEESFAAAWESQRFIRTVTSNMRWMSRPQAERSRVWVQVIAGAVIRSPQGYLVLRRNTSGREDLRSRVSLVSGGHIDYMAGARRFSGVLEETLRRELLEELDIRLSQCPEPLGIVIDHSSVGASRHVAFLYEVFVKGQVKVRAGEEFALGSKFSGSFIPLRRIANFVSRLDPWSRILWDEHFALEPRSAFQGERRSRRRTGDQSVWVVPAEPSFFRSGLQ